MSIEYTEDDELHGPEFRDSRREMRLVREELNKVSWKTIRAFTESFPCPQPSTTISVLFKEYLKEQAIIKILLDKDPTKLYQENYSPEYIQYHSFDDFWIRWNKFKKLRAFL